MPILKPEISLLPENLFDTDREVTKTSRWWVLHVKPRAEKTVARLLAGKDVPFFLPLYEPHKGRQPRSATSHVPLFPGYVFLRGGDEERLVALETNRIANCIRVEDQELMDRDLFRIHASIESGTALLPEERIQPGTPAEIVSGPLMGHQGVVIRSGKNLKFVIEVNFLQRGASIEVDSSMIRPLS